MKKVTTSIGCRMNSCFLNREQLNALLFYNHLISGFKKDLHFIRPHKRPRQPYMMIDLVNQILLMVISMPNTTVRKE
jgi:hypothetical protein